MLNREILPFILRHGYFLRNRVRVFQEYLKYGNSWNSSSVYSRPFRQYDGKTREGEIETQNTKAVPMIARS